MLLMSSFSIPFGERTRTKVQVAGCNCNYKLLDPTNRFILMQNFRFRESFCNCYLQSIQFSTGKPRATSQRLREFIIIIYTTSFALTYYLFRSCLCITSGRELNIQVKKFFFGELSGLTIAVDI